MGRRNGRHPVANRNPAKARLAVRTAIESLETRILLDGEGLLAQYFNNRFLADPVAFSRTEPQVNFSYAVNAPTGTTGVGADEFSIRWEGTITPTVTDTYKFYTRSDDGMRLWVNGQAMTNDWRNQSVPAEPGVSSTPIALAAGNSYSVVLEYYEVNGASAGKLSWSRAGAPIPVLVPQNVLSPSVAVPIPPTSVTVTNMGSLSVDLSWTDNSNNEARFKIEASTNEGSTYSSIADAPANTTVFTLTSLSPSANYLFRVRASSAAGDSSPSTPVAASTLPLSATPGLLGSWYNSENLSGPVVAYRVDPSLAFNWPSGSPGIAGVRAEWSSSRWEGMINAPTTGSYTLYTDSDDGVRVWVNGSKIIDSWIGQALGSEDTSTPVTLTAGTPVPIRIEYSQYTLGAGIFLSWAGPGILKTIVPTAALSTRVSPPPAPSNFAITEVTPTSVRYSFNLASGSDSRLALERSTDGVNFISYQGTPIPSDLAPSTKYYFRVRALSTTGDSAASNVAIVTTPAISMTPVASFQFSEGTGTTTSSATGSILASLVNGPIWAAGDGRPGPSLSFNSTAMQSVVTSSSPLSLSPGSKLTIAAWINPSDWGTPYTDANRRVLQFGSTPDNGYGLYAEDGNFKFVVGGVGQVSAPLPTTNTWHHVAGTYDGSALRLYIDCGLATVLLVAAPMVAGVGSLMIGGKPGSSVANDYFNGKIDDVRVYEVALTLDQIAALALPGASIPAVPTGLTATTLGHVEVRLNWVQSQAGSAGARVERSTDGLNFAEVGSVGAGILTFLDTNLAAGAQYYYRVRSFNGAGSSLYSNVATTTTSTGNLLPLPLSDADIGTPNIKGDVTYDSTTGSFLAFGTGSDIYNTQDQFHFVYQPFRGDGEIKARVLSIGGTNQWAKAGVMFRGSLDDDAQFVNAVVSPGTPALGSWTSFQWRSTAGSSAQFAGPVPSVTPQWVRLVRSGDTFTAYRADDLAGGHGPWIQLGTPQTISMGQVIYAGLVVNSHNEGAQIASSIDKLSIIQPQPIDVGTPISAKISSAGEVDDFSFFQRAGRKVTIAINPGSGGSPPAPSPQLIWASVQLLDSIGNILASSANTVAGGVVTLNNITLPADGTYRIRVTAPAGHSNVTGNYVTSVWDVTSTVRTLNLEQTSAGTITNPYSTDQWSFSAVAGQQVRLQVLNTSSAGLAFTLTAPNGSMPFTDIFSDSSLVTLPSSGSYTFSARGLNGASGSYSFIMKMNAVDLTLGTTYNGTLAGSGSTQFFRIAVPTAKPMILRLADPRPADHNEVYLKFGSPPTRSDYDYRFTSAASANQTLVVPSADAGSWYALVYGESVPTPGSFTMRADSSNVIVTEATPDHSATGSPVSMRLTGAGFDNTTTVSLVAANSTVYPAATMSADLYTQMTATFNLASVPAGVYSVRVTRAGEPTTLPNAFTVTAAGAAKLQTDLILPSAFGRHQLATLYIQYANTGNVAMPAPLLVLRSADPDGSDKPLMTLDSTKITAGFWTSAIPDGFSTSISILGSGAVPGVLQPGESVKVPVYYAGLLQPWDFSDNNVELEVRAIQTTDAYPMDWAALKTATQPPGIGAEAWNVIFANVVAQTGSTWGNYVQMLDNNATQLGRLGEIVGDVGQLWNFQVEQANGLSPLSSLGSAVDASVPAPGLDLSFSRSFGSTINSRYASGAFGRGWSVPWQASLSTLSDGTVAIKVDGVNQQRYQPDSRHPGTYFSANSDSSILTIATGGVFTLKDASGQTTTFRADGKLNYIQDTNGNRITAAYSASGQLSSLTHSSGQSLTIAYNAAGLIASITDSMGRQAIYIYDAANQHLLSVQTPQGTTTYAYSIGNGAAKEHAITSIQFPDGTHSYFTYDSQGHIITTSRDDGAEQVIFSYGQPGEVTSTDAAGGSSKISFNELGLLARQQDALGNASTYVYDPLTLQVSKITDAAGQAQSFKYDSVGNLASITDQLGNKTLLTHGALNRLTSVQDANGNLTTYAYDPAGNPLSTTYANNSAERSTFDPLGNARSFTNRRGQAVNYAYNASGQVTRETFPDTSHIDFTYDAHGNLKTATDATGPIIFTYDSGDHLTGVSYPNGQFLTFALDAAGRRTRMVDQTGSAVNYSYDATGRLSGLTDGSNALIVSYTYDAAGRLSRKDNGNGTYTTYQYDENGNVLHLMNTAPGGAINSRFDYTYDSLGSRTSMATIDGTWNYGYDGTGQLTRAVFASTNPSIANQYLTYNYDALGNRTSTVINGVTTAYSSNGLNQYTSVGGVAYSYDADGNPTYDGVNTYSYDFLDRLVSVTGPDGTTAYTYDALGNRSASAVNGQFTEYLNDPTGLVNIVGEFDGAGAILAHNTYGVGLVGRVTGVAASSSNYFFDFDGTGNTVGLTREGNGYINGYSYLPFGEPVGRSEATLNPFRFNGQFGVATDAANRTLMGARNYSNAIGRFLTTDPLRLLGSGSNLYRFAYNDAISFVDPSGLGAVALVGPPIVGALASTATNVATGQTKGIGNTLRDFAENLTFGFVPSTLPTIVEGQALIGLPTLGPALQFASDPNNVRDIANGINAFQNASANGGILNASEAQALREMGLLPVGNPVPPAPPTGSSGPGSGAGGGTSGTAGSHDPNDKLGPVGYGVSNFVPGSKLLTYRIDFENDAAATAPAQSVTITDPLAPTLDWRTFSLTGIGFGDIILLPPPGAQHYQTTQSMTYNGHTFDVLIEAGIHTDTGVVYATFQSLDPATSLPPDVLTGFLPPEDGTGRGLGSLSYTIRQMPGLITGTQIRNVAQIIFDSNVPISTDQLDPHDASKGVDSAKQTLVTIDAVAPISSVASLPASISGWSIPVSWTGQDDVGGSGIGKYDVYVSVDGGTFMPWLTGTTLTSSSYTAIVGHAYGFYSVAYDNVGNVQPTPTAAQATTTTVPAFTLLAGGPYTITEGQSLTLSATGPLAPGYSWDINGDGVFTDAVGASPTLTWAQLNALGINDGPATFIVRLRLSDINVSDSLPVTLTVVNAPPTLSYTSALTTNEGSQYTLNFSATDPGNDTISNWRVNWGDGSALQSLLGNVPSVSHVYADGPNIWHIAVTGTDEDGSYDAYNTAVGLPGLPDSTFGFNGYEDKDLNGPDDAASRILITPDGEFLVAGSNSPPGGFNSDFVLAKYDSNGVPDSSFGGGTGVVNTIVTSGNDYARDALLQPDGKIVLVGAMQGGSTGRNFALVRYKSDGTRDNAFGVSGNGIVENAFSAYNDEGNTGLLQAGKIIVAGWADLGTGGNPDFALTRHNANGTLDTSFGVNGRTTTSITAGFDVINALAFQSDGKIIAVGQSNGTDFAVARYSANGILDTTFGIGGYFTVDFGFGADNAQALAILPDDRILVVGQARTPSGYALAMVRFGSNGLPDGTFGTGGKRILPGSGDSSGRSILLQPSGKFLVAGSAQDQFALYRFNPDGTPDLNFAVSGISRRSSSLVSSTATSIAQQADGKFVLAGFGDSGTSTGTNFILARYNDADFSVSVANVAPTVSLGPNRAANPGQSVTLNAVATDPGSLDSIMYLWQRNGTIISGASGASYTFISDGTAATYTVIAIDKDDGIGTASVLITVNVPPTTTGFENVTVNEDAPSTVVDLWGAFSDAQDPDPVLAYSIESDSNPGLFSSALIDATTGQLTLKYFPDAFGSATLLLRATDTGGLSTFAVLNVRVNPVNDAPTLDSIANKSGPQDSGSQSVSLTGIGSGAANENQLLDVIVSASNPALFSSMSVAYISPLTTGVLNFTPAHGAVGSATITVTVSDNGGTANGGINTFSRTFTIDLTPVASVVGRSVFYNRSRNDGMDAAANAQDDAAIAADKMALRPGQVSTPSNISAFAGGINGIMVDVAGLPGGTALSLADFDLRVGNAGNPAGWSVAPAPAALAVRRGAGTGGSDRITLTWNYGAIVDKWLRVTVKANAQTGLAADDVFYFGSLVADANGDGSVSRDDLAALNQHLGQFNSDPSSGDFNADGTVSFVDFQQLELHFGQSLSTLSAPVLALPAPATSVSFPAPPPVPITTASLPPATVTSATTKPKTMLVLPRLRPMTSPRPQPLRPPTSRSQLPPVYRFVSKATPAPMSVQPSKAPLESGATTPFARRRIASHTADEVLS